MPKIAPRLALLFFVLCGFTGRANAQMSVHYIDVGQGDAILLEFPRAAVLIDAGEETTNARPPGHLLDYLNKFFARRTDLKRTIHTIIVTHPHIDHTLRLPEVVRTFHVLNLIDGGDTSGGGIVPLKQARALLSSHGGRVFSVKDAQARFPSFSLPAFTSLQNLDRDVGMKLLNGSRDCEDLNNNSLVLLVSYRQRRFLFTGDAESQGDGQCRDLVSTLLERSAELLRADVLKVNYHGSANGVTDDWMREVRPSISVITAGRSEEKSRGPGEFHAWQFGHPRDSAVRILEEWTSGSRPPRQDVLPKQVVTMRKSRLTNSPRPMVKAVYCTCWDGDVVVTTDGYYTLDVSTSR